MTRLQLILIIGGTLIILVKMLIFFILYQYTFSIEAKAKARNTRRRELESLRRSRRLKAEETVDEEQTREALAHLKRDISRRHY